MSNERLKEQIGGKASPPPDNGKEGKAPPKETEADKGFRRMKELLEKASSKLAEVLPRHMSPIKLIRLALSSIGQDERLHPPKGDEASVILAVLKAAQLGLDIGIHAALAPFWNSSLGKFECVLIPTWMGLLDLARRSGKIIKVDAQVVHEHDFFEMQYGTEEYLHFRPLVRGDRGDPILAFAMATFTSGEKQWEFMLPEEIEKIKKVAAKGKRDDKGELKLSSAWKEWEEEMWRKCPTRRLMKYLPQTPELIEGAALIDAEMTGKAPAVIDLVPESVTSEEPAPPEGTPADRPAITEGDRVEEIKAPIDTPESLDEQDRRDAAKIPAGSPEKERGKKTQRTLL